MPGTIKNKVDPYKKFADISCAEYAVIEVLKSLLAADPQLLKEDAVAEAIDIVRQMYRGLNGDDNSTEK